MGILQVETPTDRLELVKPTAKFRADFLAMAEEFRQEGDYRFDEVLRDDGRGFEGFLEHLCRQERGVDLPPGQVQTFTYWLVRGGGRIVGTVRLRLKESPYGHIGYDVRPSERGHGYGNLLLELVLPKARAEGLSRVRLRCRADNIPSRRIIEKCRGVLASQTPAEDGTAIYDYWIEL